MKQKKENINTLNLNPKNFNLDLSKLNYKNNLKVNTGIKTDKKKTEYSNFLKELNIYEVKK